MSDVKELIDGLNEDLAAEYQAVIMYRTYAALLADKIVALGGTPAVTPPPVVIAKDNREMLEYALQAEVDTIERYTRRIGQAEKAGEISIKIQLEDLIVDESNHRDDIRRMLMDWK